MPGLLSLSASAPQHHVPVTISPSRTPGSIQSGRSRLVTPDIAAEDSLEAAAFRAKVLRATQRNVDGNQTPSGCTFLIGRKPLLEAPAVNGLSTSSSSPATRADARATASEGTPLVAEDLVGHMDTTTQTPKTRIIFAPVAKSPPRRSEDAAGGIATLIGAAGTRLRASTSPSPSSSSPISPAAAPSLSHASPSPQPRDVRIIQEGRLSAPPAKSLITLRDGTGGADGGPDEEYFGSLWGGEEPWSVRRFKIAAQAKRAKRQQEAEGAEVEYATGIRPRTGDADQDNDDEVDSDSGLGDYDVSAPDLTTASYMRNTISREAKMGPPTNQRPCTAPASKSSSLRAFAATPPSALSRSQLLSEPRNRRHHNLSPPRNFGSNRLASASKRQASPPHVSRLSPSSSTDPKSSSKGRGRGYMSGITDRNQLRVLVESTNDRLLSKGKEVEMVADGIRRRLLQTSIESMQKRVAMEEEAVGLKEVRLVVRGVRGEGEEEREEAAMLAGAGTAGEVVRAVSREMVDDGREGVEMGGGRGGGAEGQGQKQREVASRARGGCEHVARLTQSLRALMDQEAFFAHAGGGGRSVPSKGWADMCQVIERCIEGGLLLQQQHTPPHA